jgi:hypothetical protein
MNIIKNNLLYFAAFIPAAIDGMLTLAGQIRIVSRMGMSREARFQTTEHPN